jgi:hypothetical protein
VKQLDRATRAFWRARGRPVDLDGAHRWLAAPMHDTQRVGDGWLRTAAADLGATLREPPDAGLPRSRQPSVHVAFPLEDGNVQVFLQPSVLPDGALLLTSDSGDFGENGAYVSSKARMTTTPPGCRSTSRSGSTSTAKACCVRTTSCGCGRPRCFACTTSSTLLVAGHD